MPDLRRLTPSGPFLFTKSNGWWAVELANFPGAYSQGRTIAEAYANILDAIHELMLSYREQGQRRQMLRKVSRGLRKVGSPNRKARR